MQLTKDEAEKLLREAGAEEAVAGLFYVTAKDIAAVIAAHTAKVLEDVKPVAWMGVSGVGERIVSKTQMYPFMTTPLYPAHTVAALAARVAELEKDAGRYRWLRDGELTAEYPYPVMRMGGSRVDDPTIWAEELDAAIDAAALAAKGQAS